MLRRRSLPLWALGLCCACATERPLTWDDVGQGVASVDGGARVAASRATSARGPLPVPPEPADTDAQVSSGVLIDRALVDLTATRAVAHRQGALSPLWSEAWLLALRRIDDALTRAPIASDLGAFVRARVTLEVELQNDEQRQVVLPGNLTGLVTKTLLGVDESVIELRAANAPGTFAPMPRLTDDELVLHSPIAPLRVTSPFGRRVDPFTAAPRFHAGVDLDGAEGSPVYASASGVVVYAGPQGGYGRYVVLDHGDGVRTHYAHLSTILVDVGAMVTEGDVIAAVGSTGRSTGPHLHFAVTDALGAFIDPVAVLDVPFAALAGQVARTGGSRIQITPVDDAAPGG